MNLEFEVNGQVLKRTDDNEVVNKNYNIYRCIFTFEDEDWVDLNKFAIFKDGWGNTETVHIGKNSNKLCCLVPNEVLNGTYFKVSIYGGDQMATSNVSIPMVTSGYTGRRSDPACSRKQKDIFVEIFEQLDSTIDSIVYADNCLHLFSRDRLIESVYLPFIDGTNVEELMRTFSEELQHKADIDHVHTNVTSDSAGFMSSEDKAKLDSIENGANRTIVDTTLDHTSPNAISNSAVSTALDGKEDSFDFIERMDNLIIDLINKED